MLLKSLISLKNTNIETTISFSNDLNKKTNESINFITSIKSTSTFFTRPNFINF
ncbi:hypothetical protein DDB_G0276639 [Dictyostelium discoideum AX4]|uniref:Uncharacterized protein n=1 Tax=Dictyostelium discoideum TaxID=44689 RepID=Q551E5_DICDI|nr:hypothetical protein DDB_G0276639 [Dictyostelium discoideum AX4]EAL69132.1 hypothetical protein DDB_G0276639 [Dictyostelium discoideum AX4]|eukprot:XP_643048.1 hypothetical protein DDB_G0276639 [Dictyostelium discoideum AX4]